MNCLEYSPNYIYQNYLGALKMLGLLPQTYRMRISGREAREAPSSSQVTLSTNIGEPCAEFCSFFVKVLFPCRQ